MFLFLTSHVITSTNTGSSRSTATGTPTHRWIQSWWHDAATSRQGTKQTCTRVSLGMCVVLILAFFLRLQSANTMAVVLLRVLLSVLLLLVLDREKNQQTARRGKGYATCSTPCASYLTSPCHVPRMLRVQLKETRREIVLSSESSAPRKSPQ